MQLKIEIYDRTKTDKRVKSIVGEFKVEEPVEGQETNKEYTTRKGLIVKIDLKPKEKETRPNALAVESRAFKGRRVIDMGPKTLVGETYINGHLGLRVSIRENQ